MKNMYLILAMLLLFTGCEKEEAKEEEQQDPSVIALQKIYDNSNGKGDAISITMEDLEATKVTDLIATKLPQYQTSIGAKTDFSNPAKVSELQILVMNANENSIIGKWELIETYFSPGGGNLIWQPFIPEKSPVEFSIIEFTEDNKVMYHTNYNNMNCSLGCYVGNYTLLSTSNNQNLSFDYQERYNQYYFDENNNLILGEPCFEPCLSKFKRINN